MPRKPTGRKTGHPLKPIDWKRVDTMILAGCSGTEIAGFLEVCADTFYRRFEDEKGVTFTAYRPSRKAGGAAMIRTRQFQSALQGNTAMLKLLGEVMLGQGKEGGDVELNLVALKKMLEGGDLSQT